MALAYTAPTWEDGSGTGISASQLQALCNGVEGLIQGTDKAVHSITFSGSTMTLIFADGSQETSATSVKGISSISKTGTSGNVDTYTITYSDGTTGSFTVTNGSDGAPGATPTITMSATADATSSATPTVTVTKTGTDAAPNFALAFSGLKGAKGDTGDKGDKGDKGNTGATPNITAYATISGGTGTPYVEVAQGGTATNPTITFGFGNLKGETGATGATGADGQDGADGVSPEVTIGTITGGHSVTITDADHPSGQTFNVMDGADGQDGTDGTDGTDGYSPVVTITPITGGNRVNITDSTHPSGQNFDVMNGTGSGDMLSSVYDSTSAVATAGGIVAYVSDAIDDAITSALTASY